MMYKNQHFRCPTCTFCVFCDEDCLQNSWQAFHKYECLGMQSRIWYEYEFYEFFRTFEAFRAICLGIASKFAAVKSNEITRFGSKEDNYPYFNSLLSHWKYCSTLNLDQSCKVRF